MARDAVYIKDLEQSFPNSAQQVHEVLRTYIGYNKFNLFGLAPNMCSKIENISNEIINQALSIYKQKAQKDHKAPHPNYFITICNRLNEEGRTSNDEPPLILGKGI